MAKILSGRLTSLFADRLLDRKKVLVTYLCVGDPDLDESLELARACVRAGADVLELGVPFSDPTADGPAIARASQRALQKGGGFAPTVEIARAIRAESDVPIVLFGYYNPIYVYGEARAVDVACDAGVDAFLVVDLPLEEGRVMRDEAAERGMAVVPLLTPTSSATRVEAVRRQAETHPIGFVYYVSVTGVTGSAAMRADEAGAEAGKLREKLRLPVLVGFGIDSREKCRAAGSPVDGVIVGTAIVKAIEDGRTAKERVSKVVHLVAELRAGLDAAGAAPSLPK
jgi:tryptophan synthase alpha chain